MNSFSLPREGETVRDAVVRNMVLYKVQRDITCPVTGQVLDVRTCVALVGGPDNDDVLAVVSPDGWAQRGQALREKFPHLSAWTGDGWMEQPAS